MILVIADDLTGAAEVGGIGLRYGLSVKIITDTEIDSQADLLIISTDTRSMAEPRALAKTVQVTFVIYKLKPEVIFKKVDSVLRGHIVNELKVHLPLLDLERALLIPSNPAFGRTISGGQYFIHDTPIHLTSFAHDPEFGVTSNDVLKMLRTTDEDVHLHSLNDQLPTSGIIMGDCITNQDLTSWVNKSDKNTLLAGGSGLFIALLETQNLKQQPDTDEQLNDLEYPALFVCGSTHDKSRSSIKKIVKNGGPVSYMPIEIINSTNPPASLFKNWADEIVSLLNSHKKAIIAIHEESTKVSTITAADLRDRKAMVVERVLQQTTIKELLIEGGSTASAIINRLNINKFSPVKEFSTGVIKMKVDGIDDLFLTLKPGSYDWPATIWDFNKTTAPGK